MADPTLVETVERRIAKAQRARDAISGHGGSASGYPEDVVTLSLEEAVALVAEVRRLEGELSTKSDADLEGMWDRAHTEGFRAGAEHMREAAASEVVHEVAAESEYLLSDVRRWYGLAGSIRALPVPPAPSPAHDGKEGAPRG